MGGNRVTWTDTQREKLRDLWSSPGVSARTLALAIGHSGEACRNEAHRLGLPARAPIRAQGSFQPATDQARTAHPLPAGAHTLPPLASELAALRPPDD